MKKKLFVCLLMVTSLLITKSVYAETYDGEYSIDYLLKNYSFVTLGKKEYKTFYSNNDEYYGNVASGDLIGIHDVEGAVIVGGNYRAPYYNVTFGEAAGNVKSFVKGTIDNKISTPSEIINNSSFLDLNKMYSSVMYQSLELADNAQYHINDYKIEIDKPGNYTIHDTSYYFTVMNSQGQYINSDDNSILIKDYDRNGLYIFNFYDEYVSKLIHVKIMEKGSSYTYELHDYIESGKYTGNIVYNYPNAKYINCANSDNIVFDGSIVAPNANVTIYLNSYMTSNNLYLSIIANTIEGRYQAESELVIKKNNISINEKIGSNYNGYVENIIDYPDDGYSRDYSIKDLLENYNLITLGHKAIDEKSKILEYGNTPGSVKLFHITGQALIAGDLYGNEYTNGYNFDFDRTAFDLESNKVTESYVKGNIFLKYGNSSYYVARSVIQPWDNMKNDNVYYSGKKNLLMVSNNEGKFDYRHAGSGNFTFIVPSNFINFDRLYNNVVAEQKEIEEGAKLTVGSDGILHIPIGGNYTIEDISNVKEIVFDNFEKNKDELTIITIKNDGDIKFPLISKDGNGYKGIVTNDYYGKEKATHLYELDTFLSEDSYYGNIVWNLPNADYIKLKENAPFAGHMIAPNADVETPELHFAGCFIVNSIYGEGNTEAHFYPINSDCKCVSSEYDSLSETQKKKFNDYRLRKSLGGDNTIIEKEIIGDKAQYDKDVALFESLIEKCDNREIIVNPKTAGTIAILFGIISLAFIGLLLRKKKVQ